MTTEQYSIGYEEGYQAGWNEAMEARPASKPWVGLTDEQIQAIAFEAVKDNWDWLKFARAIEANLKEKNA